VRLARLWTDAELRADAGRRREARQESAGALSADGASRMLRETVRLLDSGYKALYTRDRDGVVWTRIQLRLRSRAAAKSSHWPEEAVLRGDVHVPPRTCKNRTVFRERLLRRVHDVHRILGNLVLFYCRISRERFPTFHPAHAPPVAMSVLASCPVAVAEWEGGSPVDERHQDAVLCRGVCQRCADELRLVEHDQELRGVARFSAANHMDPLMGYPDDVAARRELDQYIDSASVVESMVVALHHMQISVCYLRGRRERSSGLSCFRKNIISFPQDLVELQQLHTFMSGLQPNDVVNVDRSDGPAAAAGPNRIGRARVVRSTARGFVVQDAHGVVRDVPRQPFDESCGCRSRRATCTTSASPFVARRRSATITSRTSACAVIWFGAC